MSDIRFYFIFLLLSTFGLAFGQSVTPPSVLVNPLVDSHKSRWFYFSSACRPFGMVSLSPDTWPLGSWNSGYLYDTTSIRCFSHVHCWEISGIPVMPTTGSIKGHLGFEANKSKFSHKSEVVKAGYHKVLLEDYGIAAELTSTCRVGFHRYTFPQAQKGNILFDIGAELGQGTMDSAFIQAVNNSELSGYAVMSPSIRRKKPCTVYFVARFNKKFDSFGGWKKTNSNAVRTLITDSKKISGKESGGFVTFAPSAKPVLLKVAISYVSEEQARLNLESELPHWDFDRVVKESALEWDHELGKIKVEGGTHAQQVKFYTDLWHALLGRHIFSDINGKYVDNTGAKPLIRQIPIDKNNKPIYNHHNTDAFWGAEWNLNILWSMAYPKVMNDFVNTLVDYYSNGGLIARGPSGGNYTFVMVGDQAIPLIAAAYNKGIRNFDIAKAYEGSLKNSEPGGIRDHAGYEVEAHPYMKNYVERGYVPEGIDGKGWHREGCALTLYFAYQDWCMAQFAKGLGKTSDYEKYYKRSFSYQNVFDTTTRWMRPREQDGSWMKDFAPVTIGFNAKGFVEGNSATYTYYVPQNIPDLIQMIGGKEAFVEKLSKQFELATPNKYITPHGKHSESWVDYENQPSLHMAHLFSHAGAPWLTQYWVRKIKDEIFSDITPYGGYNGDEDQGQFGALGVLMAMGIFDVEGGTSVTPKYEITSPIFDKITIALDNKYYPGKEFIIVTQNNKPGNIYIQSATFNGKELNDFRFLHQDFVKGGVLEIKLGPEPNKIWGTAKQTN